MNGIRVLLIDDEPSITEMLRLFMEYQGAIVTDFQSAEEGIAYLETHARDVDVIVTDFSMPGYITGGDIFALTKSKYTHVVCFIMSGFIDVLPDGIDPFYLIDKPVNFNFIAARINEALNRPLSTN